MAAGNPRSVFKFVFWTLAAAALFVWVTSLHRAGKLQEWFYYSAGEEGFAVDADNFPGATAEAPALLMIGEFREIKGLQAVPVKEGDRLPAQANGIITKEILEQGKRATLEGDVLKVTAPWEIQTAKGFKFKDTFKHKGIRTYPWAAVFNVVVVITLGVTLGLMAEGFTDTLGIKLEKIQHFEGH